MEDKSPNEVYFDKLNLGNNNTEIYYSSTNSFDRSGKKLGVNNIVKIEGEKFDASGIINGLGDDSNTGLKSSLTLDAKLGEVIMSKTARLKNFTAEVKCGFERCFSGNANGNFASGGSVAINFYQKLIDNEYQGVFKLTSDNAGKIFESLNLFDNVQKGFVTINSVTKYTNKPITNGDIFIKDYKIVKAPTLARIFSLASFSGIATLLSNSGVPMKKLSGAFSMRDGYVSIQDIRSFGDSLGLTSQGTYNIRSGVVDLSGAVTPSYSVNSFLGKIPILGNLFTAGEGEGLIAAKYSVSGKQPNINVSVNPLSALTPGFLRKIWGNSSTEIKIEDEANDKKTKYPARRNR